METGQREEVWDEEPKVGQQQKQWDQTWRNWAEKPVQTKCSIVYKGQRNWSLLSLAIFFFFLSLWTYAFPPHPSFTFCSCRIEMFWNYMIRSQYHVLLYLTYQCSWKVCNESHRNLQKEKSRDCLMLPRRTDLLLCFVTSFLNGMRQAP